MYRILILIVVAFSYSCASPNTESICEDNPCTELNRGLCSPTGSSYICSCDLGYKDKHGVCIKDATSNPCYPNPCQNENRNVCNGDSGIPICLCNSSFHDESDICMSDIKTVNCKANETIPKDSYEVISDIEIIYENNQWGEPAYCDTECNDGFNKNDNNECVSIENDPCDDVSCEDNASCDAGNCLCDSGYHKEGSLCEANKKTVDCDSSNPRNSTKVDAQVEVVYTEGVGWSIPTDCAWNCNADFHKEGDICVENALTCAANEHEENDECISNTKMVNCSDNTPTNATKISSQVEVNYTSDNGWSMPVGCAWSCNDNFHKDGDFCSSDTRTVDCDDSSIPDDSTKVLSQVEIVYTEGVGWSLATSCLWNCNVNFHEESNQCLSNTKMLVCNENFPSNSVNIDAQVEVTYSDGVWSIPADCDWSCNTTFHKEGDICVADGLNCSDIEHEENDQCVGNTKMLACNDSSPLNATKVDAQVEVSYTQENGWTSPTDCAWNCNTGYHEENASCIEDGTIACDDQFEANNTFDTAKSIVDSNSRGPQHSNLTICEGDEDWYKIESESNSGLEIDVTYTHVTGECDIDMKLYKMVNGSLSQVDTSGNFGGLETVYIRNTITAETYYLKVFGYNSNCENPYTLTANIFNDCIDDEEGASVSEQDDTLEQAVSFSLNTEYNRVICDYDDDWYGYYFNAGDSIKISLDLININGDLDISLYDASGSSLDATYGTLDNEVIDYDITADGNYFIKVRGWNGSQNNYTLKVVDGVSLSPQVVFDTGNQSYELLDNDCKVFEAPFIDQVTSTTATVSSFTMNNLLLTHEFLSDINIYLAIGDETYTQIWSSSDYPSMLLDNDRDDDDENDADIDLLNRNYDYFNGNSLGDKILRLKVCDDYASDIGFLNILHFTIEYNE